jgi:hypothetical protein
MGSVLLKKAPAHPSKLICDSAPHSLPIGTTLETGERSKFGHAVARQV